jgi:hypothetical protein
MDVVAKRARYREVREKALGITDRAIADDRKLTTDEVKQLDQLVKEGKQLASEMEGTKLGAPDGLLEKIKQFAATPGVTETEVPEQLKNGEMLLGRKDGERTHPWAEAIVEACKAHGTKAFGMPTGSVPLVSLGTTPVSMGQLGAPLVSAIGLTPWPAGGGRAVQYLRQTGRTNRAAIWAPGSAADGADTVAKPTSDYTTALVQADVSDIAHLASPVRKDDLSDFENLSAWVASELMYGLGQALEAAALAATGPEPKFTGLLHVAGTTPVAAAADVPSTLMAASVALSNLGYGTGLSAAMNPADWSALALSKASTAGTYLFPGLPAAAASPSVLGMGVIVSPNVSAGTAVVSNFRSSCRLFEREAPVVEWGTVNDQFTKNLLTARCEGRYAFAVEQPAAIAIADLTP